MVIIRLVSHGQGQRVCYVFSVVSLIVSQKKGPTVLMQMSVQM